MKGPRFLDYATKENLIIPVLFLDSDHFLKLIDECETGLFTLKQKQRTKKRGA